MKKICPILIFVLTFIVLNNFQARAEEVYLTPQVDGTIIKCYLDGGPGYIMKKEINEYLKVGKDDQGCEYHSLMRFDLTGIPYNAKVKEGKVRLSIGNIKYFGSNDLVSIQAYLVKSGWFYKSEEGYIVSPYGWDDRNEFDYQNNSLVAYDTKSIEFSILGGNTVTSWLDESIPNQGIRLSIPYAGKGVVASLLSSRNTKVDPQMGITKPTLHLVYEVPAPEPLPSIPTSRTNTTRVADKTPPVVSNVVAKAGSSAVRITWTTDEPTTGTVSYGDTSSYTSSLGDRELTKNHEIVITNLHSAKIYHYSITARDASGNSYTTKDATFATIPLKSNPTLEQSHADPNVEVAATSPESGETPKADDSTVVDEDQTQQSASLNAHQDETQEKDGTQIIESEVGSNELIGDAGLNERERPVSNGKQNLVSINLTTDDVRNIVVIAVGLLAGLFLLKKLILK